MQLWQEIRLKGKGIFSVWLIYGLAYKALMPKEQSPNLGFGLCMGLRYACLILLFAPYGIACRFAMVSPLLVPPRQIKIYANTT